MKKYEKPDMIIQEFTMEEIMLSSVTSITLPDIDGHGGSFLPDWLK